MNTRILSSTKSFLSYRRTTFFLLLFTSLFAAACHRDPAVRKQNFLEQGNRDFDKGNYSAALISYGRALQVDPRFAEAHFKMALTHLKMGSWPSAYQELRRTVDLQPENWPAQLQLSQLELAAGKRQEAKDRALLILHSEPKNADAQMLLADSDAALGDLPKALEETKDAVAMSPDRAAVYLNLGQIQMRAGKMEDAEASFKRARELDSKSVVPFMTLGTFYAREKRWTEAQEQFKAAIQRAPNDVVPRAALAGLYFGEGQVAQAEQVLTDAKNQLSSNPAAYRMLGDSYLSRGEMAKAVSEFGALSAKYPNDLSVRRSYIQLLILNDRLDEANQLTEEILRKNSKDGETLVLKGQTLLKQHKVDEAITTLQAALTSDSNSAFGHYQLGVAFREKGNAQQAESEWREAVRLRPNLSEAWLALCAGATQRSDWHSLQNASEQMMKYAPNSIDAYLNHATARFNQGDAVGAGADLLHVQQIAPQSAVPYAKLGQLRLAMRQPAEAETLFRQALSLDPDSLEAIRGIVQVDLLKNKPAEALKFVREQITRNPNKSELYLLQGELLLQSKQLDPALESLQRAVELNNKSVSALALLAQVQGAKGQPDQAIANYQKAIELAPNDTRLYVTLGTLYESVGNWQRAQATYEKALAIQPDNALAANNLAYLLLEHGGSPNVALSLAETARKGLPKLPNSADTLGWAYYNNGAYSVAAPLFEDAVKNVPNNQTYRYHLGLTYEKLNDSSRAKVELEKAIALNPTSPLADQARRALSELTGG